MDILIPAILIVAIVVVAKFAFLNSKHRSPRKPEYSAKVRQQRTAVYSHRSRMQPEESEHDIAGDVAPWIGLDFSRLVPAPEGRSTPVVTLTTSGRKDDLLYSCRGKGEQLTSLARSISTQIHTQKAILDRLSKPSADPRELSEMVESDPVLTGKILKTINSSYYGLMEPVGSVFRAVLLLGHVEVRNIVWRSCISGSMKPVSGPATEIHDTLWRHSFVVSRAAFELARHFSLPEPDVISTAALLHDIGRIIFLSVSPEQALSLYEPVRFSDHQLLGEEERVIGLPHTSLGSEIARMWGLPGTTRAMIQHHHAPSYIDPDAISGDPRPIAIIHIADILSHLAGSNPEDSEHQIYLPKQKWLDVLGVTSGLKDLCISDVLEVLPSRTDSSDAGARAA